VSIFNINARYLLLYKGVAGYRNYFFLETRIKISISFFFCWLVKLINPCIMYFTKKILTTPRSLVQENKLIMCRNSELHLFIIFVCCRLLLINGNCNLLPNKWWRKSNAQIVVNLQCGILFGSVFSKLDLFP
jgi:hypothetical protein